jgi:lysophospholipase L1-like esterase
MGRVAARSWGSSWVSLVVLVVAALVLAACSMNASGTRSGSVSAPRLPSAARSTPSGWTVVAVGDSVTSGTHCRCTPFPQLYAKQVARTRGVQTTAQNFGAPGQDSDELLAELQNPSSAVARSVANADIDLVTIGANDFSDHHSQVTAGSCTGVCLKGDLEHMRENVVTMLRCIHALRHGLPTAILVTGYWNVFEDGQVAQSFPPPGRKATQDLTAMANQEIRSAAHSTGATYVDLYRPFNGPAAKGDITNLLAGDGDHPNAQGQQLIADALLSAGLHGLVRD